MDEYSVVVEGDWPPKQNRTVKNKLLKHFQSEKKSGGGECRVETGDGVARAAVVFTLREVRDRVLSKPNHEITVDQTTLQLRLTVDSPAQKTTDNAPDPQDTEEQAQTDGSSQGASAPEEEHGCSVALRPVSEDMSRDLLCLLVESLSSLNGGDYELELIWESSVAVVTFMNHTEAEKFMTLSQSSGKLSKRGLNATVLQPTSKIRVERLPPTMIEDMLELYFETKWTAPDDIVMILEEQAAIVSFSDPKVVKDICSCADHSIKSTHIKVYLFYESLGAALMGSDRPEFKMPEAFTEVVLEPIWRFLRNRDASNSINQKMSPHFCHVDLDKPVAKLSPLPSFLRQKDLTKDQVEGWKNAALRAFRELMSEYGAFDCDVNKEAWKMAEKEVRAIVRDDVELILDQSRGVLTVAGKMTDIIRVRAEVEDTVCKITKQVHRDMNGVEEKTQLAPAMFHILNQSGLQKAAQDISPDVSLHFDEEVLTICGLQDEVYQLKIWILEETAALEKKQLDLPILQQDFLLNTDVKQLSQDIFISQGICAFISLETKGMFLIGSSERFVIDAEKKLLSTLDEHVLKMPEAFTELVQDPIWRFLRNKGLSDSINQKMSPHFCLVDLDKPAVKLSPLPSFLRQKDLTKDQVEGWKNAALRAFRELMSEYGAFDCDVNKEAWRMAEKEVRAIVRDDVELILDQSRGVLTVAGRMKDIKRVRADVEDTVHKITKQVHREMNGVEEKTQLAPAMFHILHQSGLQRAAQDISPDVAMHFDRGVLTISGLLGEVYRLKNWILEKTMKLEKKPLDIPRPLEDFLHKVDVSELSQDLFTSHGICAFISIETKGLFLIGSSERSISDAEKKLHSTLIVKTVNYQDSEVVKLKKWSELVENLCESFNTSSKTTMQIQVQPQKITISGFSTPVTEAAQSLSQLLNGLPEIQERVKVESCAVVEFIEKKKKEEWSSIARNNQVKAEFDAERPKFIVSGSRVHVQKAKALFLQLTQSLVTDTFQVQKPGAKKFFMSQGSLFLSTILTEFGCVVILRPELLPDEEEDFDQILDVQEGHGADSVRVRTVSGVRVSVKKADMCKLKVDAVVNSANEQLQHIGGLALALLKAAGQEMQRDCDAFIKQNRNLSPGQTFVTKSYRLPCKHVIHAVGPRYTENGAKMAVSLLKLVVKDSLTQAEKLQCSSVALPAVSSAVMGFPVELCAETIAQAVREFCDDPVLNPMSLREVLLVDNNDKTVKALAEAVKREFSDLNPTVESGETVVWINKTKGQKLDQTLAKGFGFLTPVRVEKRFQQLHQVTRQSHQRSGFMPAMISSQISDTWVKCPVLEEQEVETTVFQLCAETQRAIIQAKRRIEELILTEQAQRTISDPLLVNLTQADVDSLKKLQKSLTVAIKLETKSQEEACVHLEGLTRDVFTAESAVRDMIRRLERAESRKKNAFYLRGKVEWQFVLDNGDKRAFDIMTNLVLEEAFAKNRPTTITINNQPFTADPQRMRADCDIRRKTVELYRKECKDNTDDASLPSEWSDMKKDELLKLVKLTPGSNEYQRVAADVRQKGLRLNILSIERVQNVSLWKNYQIKKKEIDTKNGHQNNEKVLYHGTGANCIDLINKTGFNRSYAGTHAAMYGNGTYFAVDPNYSVRGYSKPDAKGHKRLYVALVLVGEFATGRQGMITPPVKKFSPSDLYDSVTDSVSNPSVYVIFNDVQAYPQYLITFT